MANNPHAIEYEITRKAFDAILGGRKNEDKKSNPYVYVMNVLNSQNRLRGTVRKLHVLEH